MSEPGLRPEAQDHPKIHKICFMTPLAAPKALSKRRALRLSANTRNAQPFSDLGQFYLQVGWQQKPWLSFAELPVRKLKDGHRSGTLCEPNRPTHLAEEML